MTNEKQEQATMDQQLTVLLDNLVDIACDKKIELKTRIDASDKALSHLVTLLKPSDQEPVAKMLESMVAQMGAIE
jgi:hypothetical protein